MSKELRAMLLNLSAEIEDLRAFQVVASVALSTLPSLSTTNMDMLKQVALEKNREQYDALRKAIEELT